MMKWSPPGLFGQFEGFAKVYSGCEVTRSSSGLIIANMTMCCGSVGASRTQCRHGRQRSLARLPRACWLPPRRPSDSVRQSTGHPQAQYFICALWGIHFTGVTGVTGPRIARRRLFRVVEVVVAREPMRHRGLIAAGQPRQAPPRVRGHPLSLACPSAGTRGEHGAKPLRLHGYPRCALLSLERRWSSLTEITPSGPQWRFHRKLTEGRIIRLGAAIRGPTRWSPPTAPACLAPPPSQLYSIGSVHRRRSSCSCAHESPCSAARPYHRTASTRSCCTPRPFSYIRPR